MQIILKLTLPITIARCRITQKSSGFIETMKPTFWRKMSKPNINSPRIFGDIVATAFRSARRPHHPRRVITTENIKHYAARFRLETYDWQQPDVSAFGSSGSSRITRRWPGRHRELLAGHSAGIL